MLSRPQTWQFHLFFPALSISDIHEMLGIKFKDGTVGHMTLSCKRPIAHKKSVCEGWHTLDQSLYLEYFSHMKGFCTHSIPTIAAWSSFKHRWKEWATLLYSSELGCSLTRMKVSSSCMLDQWGGRLQPADVSCPPTRFPLSPEDSLEISESNIISFICMYQYVCTCMYMYVCMYVCM